MHQITAQSILLQAMTTTKRFPLSLLSALIAVSGILWMTGHETTDPTWANIVHVVMASVLFLPASIGLAFFTERYHVRKPTRAVFFIGLVAVAVVYALTLPEILSVRSGYRFALLFIAAHLGVAFGPYVVNRESNGFWKYNMHLFLRFLLSGLYTGALFAGISLAFFAIQMLFDIAFSPLIYVRIGLLLAFLFNTWFFLSGTHRHLNVLEMDLSYPKGLRLFTQYVLLPLVVVYLCILYVYSAKILVTQVWPRGWVSYLVTGFSVTGILGLLLVWPLRLQDQFAWIKTYSRWFFRALFPLILLLTFAIIRRVIDYGITEDRYIIIMLTVWLLIIAFYFLFSENKEIRFIPIGLFFAILFTAFGPWNAFVVSERSQYEQLRHVLKSNSMLVGGVVVPAAQKVTSRDQATLSSIVEYMVNVHGVASLQPLFRQNLDSLLKAKPNVTFQAGEIMKLTGLDFMTPQSLALKNEPETTNFTLSVVQNGYTTTKGSSYLIPFSVYTHEQSRNFEQTVQLDSVKLEWSYLQNSTELTITINDTIHSSVSLLPMVRQSVGRFGWGNTHLHPRDIVLQLEANDFRAELLVNGIAGSYDAAKGTINISSLDGTLLVNSFPHLSSARQ